MNLEIRILQGQSRYDIFSVWQSALREALERFGISACVVPVHQDHPPGSNGNTVSLGFNLVRHWSAENRRNLHVVWAVDHPNFLGQYFLAPYGRMAVDYHHCVLASVDLRWAEFAREVYGTPGVYFLPHASVLDKAATPDWSARPLDVVFFGSFEEPEALATRLRESVKTNAAATWPFIETFLNEFRYATGHTLDRAVWDAMSRLSWPPDIARVFLNAFYPDLDSYHRYRNRAGVMRSIRKTLVHVYGGGPWSGLSLPENIVVHDSVTYPEALRIMRQAKIVLSHAPTLSNGGHERVFDAILSGCFVASAESSFLRCEFPEPAGIQFYDCEELSGADSLFSRILADPAAPERVRIAQQVVLDRHTMTQRAGAVLYLLRNRWPERFAE